jgi:hypothetical protein
LSFNKQSANFSGLDLSHLFGVEVSRNGFKQPSHQDSSRPVKSQEVLCSLFF